MRPHLYVPLLFIIHPLASAAPPPGNQAPLIPKLWNVNFTFDGSVTHCGGPDDVFQPERISLIPDPPKRGAPLTVEVIGTTTADVTDGAYADVVAKLGVIKLVDRRLDLCQEIKQIGRECPVEKGRQEITHTVDIPREVPPGKYSISVDAFNADQAPLTCLRIQFRM
ncbi:Phosphatidylglycerol/phosphatidylinositol transfer protein [Phlyctochytrium planicorne]|nr:Phosphatidylglycerol/phosphatidylinositol transfer protein [Phlyctochytrium planicorne]